MTVKIQTSQIFLSDWTEVEKADAFSSIAEQVFQKNFGKLSKSDMEVLLFSLLIDHLLLHDLPIDDYTMAKQLGIPETRIRNLKVKKELQYPSKYDWQEVFIERIPFAKYDDKKALVKISILDPNVRREIEHYVDSMNMYSEYQLNSKLLQMRPDHFVLLCEKVGREYAQKNNIEIETSDKITNRLKACQASTWIDDQGQTLLQKISNDGWKQCLGDIAKAGAKTAFKILLSSVPFPEILRKVVDQFIDEL